MDRRSSLASFAFAAMFCANASAVEFEENHLFVGCIVNHAIVEFDENLQFVRTIFPPGLKKPRSLAFGPNGLLYATSFDTQEVFEIRGDGTVSRTIKLTGGTVGPNALAFGPQGHLFVNGFHDKKMHELDVLSPTVTEFGPIALQTQALMDFEFTSMGTFYGVSMDSSFYYEVNRLGQIVRFKQLDSFTFPTAVAIGPFQQPWLSSIGKQAVIRTTASLAPLNTLSSVEFNAPAGLAFAPNGDLMVCQEGGNRVVRFDVETQQVIGSIGFNIPTLQSPVGIAYAPSRFEAEIDVKVAMADEGYESSEEDVFISIAPGSRTITVMFEEGKNGDGLASEFFQPGLTFHGTEVLDSGSKRLHEGTEVHLNNAGGIGSIALEVKGKTVGNFGYFEVSKASGRISRGGAGIAFQGTIKTTKKLN
jgi:hypothetical protein